MDEAERETRRILKSTQNNVTAAAEALGISREAVYKRCRRYGIRFELTAARKRARAMLGVKERLRRAKQREDAA